MKIPKLNFDANGLMPAIIQDEENNQVLMMGYMSRESLELTLSSGYTHFWSRSKQKIWKKGETSGHVQEVRLVLYDCDRDTLLIKIIQKGPGACHTGHRTCFFTTIEGTEIEEKVFSEEDVYRKK